VKFCGSAAGRSFNHPGANGDCYARPWALIVSVAGMAAAISASADPVLRNVTGFDPALLAGETCQGVLNTGKARHGSQGALQLSFTVDGDVLAAHFWRGLGRSTYDRAVYAITQPGQTIDATRFEDLGEVRRLTVTGNHDRFVDSTGAKVRLTYSHGRLQGRSDPRGGTDWRMTRVANVTMSAGERVLPRAGRKRR